MSKAQKIKQAVEAGATTVKDVRDAVDTDLSDTYIAHYINLISS